MADTLLQRADMAYVRVEAEKALPDICDIQERQISADGTGGYTEAWATAYQGVACRIVERSGREGVFANRPFQDGDWILTLPYDQAVDETDRVITGTRTYEVAFVNRDRTWDTVRRCLVKRLV